MFLIRGIRGATTIDVDTPEEVVEATRELLAVMVERNGIDRESIAAVMFTATSDVKSEFPALAARQMGWTSVPLLCFQEMEVNEALSRCIRVLMLINTDRAQNDIHHVYLRQASFLRQDIVE